LTTTGDSGVLTFGCGDVVCPVRLADEIPRGHLRKLDGPKFPLAPPPE
jgi:hypothetical protein